MSGALEAFARQVWGGEPGYQCVSVLLRPVSWLYGASVGVRNQLLDWGGAIRPEGVSVISVGNLAVGGTGKTPVAGWVVEHLLRQGHRPAVVARGYGRDEIALHASWHPGTPVIANPDRVAGVLEAAAQGADVVVLDDGFQHRRLARDVDLVLLAAEDRFPGHLLPSGPYRESVRGLSRADGIIVTRKVASLQTAEGLVEKARHVAPDAAVAVVHLRPAGWTTLSGEAAEAPDRAVLAAAGIARPQAFWDAVAWESGQEVELLAFADHHEYHAADIEHIKTTAGERVIVVTEKDSMKLRPYSDGLGDVRVLCQEVHFESGREDIEMLLTLSAGPAQ
jgi:tetraacyldisaccharide 4'-kinase